jgi:hypothetical protein
MSKALESLLKGYCRLSSSSGYPFYDLGVPPSDPVVAAAIALLTPRQHHTLDDGVLTSLSEALATEIDHQDKSLRTYRPAKKSKYVADVLAHDPSERGNTLVTWGTVIGLLEREDTDFIYNRLASTVRFWLRDAYEAVDRCKHTLSIDQVRSLLDASRSHKKDHPCAFHYLMRTTALNAVAMNLGNWDFSDDDHHTFRDVAASLIDSQDRATSRTHLALLRGIHVADTVLPFWDGEAWAATIIESVRSMPADLRDSWSRLLSHAGTCNSTKPSIAWLREAAMFSDALPPREMEMRLCEWLRAFVATPRAIKPQRPDSNSREAHSTWHQMEGNYSANTAMLIGMVWLTQSQWTPAFARLLADLAEAVQRLPLDARRPSANVGVAAIKAIGSRDDDDALAQLSRLELRIRWPTLKTAAKKQLEATMTRRGLDRAEVEESLVPEFGLCNGIITIPFDGAHAEITLSNRDKATLRWIMPDGRTGRVLSKALKAKNPTASIEAKQVVSDIEKLRSAQRTRLDLLMRRPRAWPYALWRQRYIDHGLVGSLANRLIWIVGDIPVICRDGTLVNLDGKSEAHTTDATVTLWHPAERSATEVLAWRDALEAWGVSQPFKQAHREVYLLTDAERRTDVYSNRFASHIVRSMALLSISQVRQWKSGLYGGHSSPSFMLTDFGLRAEWWLQPAGDDQTPFGTPLYLASDQVRFTVTSTDAALRLGHQSGLDQPLQMERVPVVAFSEIMRDVDLFVGVASIGNDPNWQDGGRETRYTDYWQNYSFGELAATAQTRKAVLQKLIPRLMIAPRCTFDDKFLIVRGNLRTYKIHLGSGNILMTPNDQYLCIVAAPGHGAAGPETGGVFLPFDGDERMSIILSKALMLADDTNIKDPTITHQIKA